MKITGLVFLTLFSTQSLLGSELDSLLSSIKTERKELSQVLKQKEKTFLSNKLNQEKLLKQAKAELKALEAQTKVLSGQFETNEKDLGELENKLQIASGGLGELFGVVKQVAGDFKGQFENSLISVQYPKRDLWLDQLAQSKKLPQIDQLKQLWFEIQREMTESGKITKFNNNVVLSDGTSVEKEITRIGSFNLISKGAYLSFQNKTGQITVLPRQPQGKFLGQIDSFLSSTEITPLGIDPSRGGILSLLVQAPSLMERVKMGGLVGIVILSLLALGIGIVSERLFVLVKAKKKLNTQLNDNNPSQDNPLGKLMSVYQKYKSVDIETLELKLEETILKALPPLERGIPTIKILAIVAPLLGLLGTVTGMIATFQSITLFGTGDPKLMAGGISTALVTTVLGLVCAIPLTLLHNLVSSQSQSLVQILEEQAAGMIALKAESKIQEQGV